VALFGLLYGLSIFTSSIFFTTSSPPLNKPLTPSKISSAYFETAFTIAPPNLVAAMPANTISEGFWG